MRTFLVLAAFVSGTSASAEPVTASAESATVDPLRDAAPADPTPEPPAPRPDQASGIEVPDDPPPHRARSIARGLLLFPRAIVWTVAQPIRGATYVYERYELRERFIDATFTDDRKLGIYPVASYDTTYGITGGARVLYKDIFGEGERIKLRGNLGGEYRLAVGARASTGRRFGRIALEADTSFERRPRERFYGIGDGSSPGAPPAELIDPSIDPTALKAR